jgi:flavin-dependent dehydrogenase
MHRIAPVPVPLGEALGEALRGEGVELVLSANAIAARHEGEEYVLEVDDGRELRGEKLLVATGPRPRVHGLGLGDHRRRAGRARSSGRRAPAGGGAPVAIGDGTASGR